MSNSNWFPPSDSEPEELPEVFTTTPMKVRIKILRHWMDCVYIDGNLTTWYIRHGRLAKLEEIKNQDVLRIFNEWNSRQTDSVLALRKTERKYALSHFQDNGDYTIFLDPNLDKDTLNQVLSVFTRAQVMDTLDRVLWESDETIVMANAY